MEIVVKYLQISYNFYTEKWVEGKIKHFFTTHL